MKLSTLCATLLVVTACAYEDGATPAPDATAPPPPPPTTSVPPATYPTTTLVPVPTPAVTTTSTTSSTTTTSPPPPTTSPPVAVTAPGAYAEKDLEIHLAFVSKVDDVTTGEFESAAMAILNSPVGWAQSGFTFVADNDSDLRVVLAEGRQVDELCLPLETFGRVSCQNGPVVALNADRWRRAFRDWTSTEEDYRFYLVTHEVGHLLGLRHPLDRCPTADRISAVMEPQTRNLDGCIGNGIPLAWEIEWAQNRPATIGPLPDWDGPRPKWPDP